MPRKYMGNGFFRETSAEYDRQTIGGEAMKSDKKTVCRWCEYYVPRAGMCTHDLSARPGMPLKRLATDSCQHFDHWKPPGDGVKELQTDDRSHA